MDCTYRHINKIKNSYCTLIIKSTDHLDRRSTNVSQTRVESNIFYFEFDASVWVFASIFLFDLTNNSIYLRLSDNYQKSDIFFKLMVFLLYRDFKKELFDMLYATESIQLIENTLGEVSIGLRRNKSGPPGCGADNPVTVPNPYRLPTQFIYFALACERSSATWISLKRNRDACCRCAKCHWFWIKCVCVCECSSASKKS